MTHPDFAQHPDFDRPELSEECEDDLMAYIESTNKARADHERNIQNGVKMMLGDIDRLPFIDCALPGCDGYAEEGENYCSACLKALRENVTTSTEA